MMGHINKRLLAIGISFSMMISSVAFLCDYSYAEEQVILTVDEAKANGISTGGVVVDVEEGFTPEFSEPIKKDYKPWLKDLLDELPESIVVKVETASKKETVDVRVPVTWECVQDYDDNLDKYDFAPVITDMEVAPNIELPSVSVEINFEIPDIPGYVPGDETALYSEDEENESEDDFFTFQAGETYYNSEELGMLPPIRNQGQYGTCWAFATLGAMECDLIHKGLADRNSIDLSELALAYFVSHRYDDPKNMHDNDDVSLISGADYLKDGGNYYIATTFLSNNVGAVPEAKVPYSLGYSAIDDRYAVKENCATLRGCRFISINDKNAVKTAIKNHGGVAATMYMVSNGTFYSATNNAYCSSVSSVNHGIMLVGWDDSFSRDNFSDDCKPNSDGAWLVRNSWGQNGNGYNLWGYFWISYEDAGLLSDKYVLEVEADTDGYENCYSYATSPLSSTEYVASGSKLQTKYTVAAGEEIKAVRVQLPDDDVTAIATVKSGDTAVSGRITGGDEGYYDIVLDKRFTLAKDALVTVTVKLTSGDGKNIIVPVEHDGEYRSSIAIYTGNYGGASYINGKELSSDLYINLLTDENSNTTDISTTEISLSKTKYTYDGVEKKPNVTVTDKGKTLTEGEDYILAYKNNKNAGTATVSVNGLGGYSGSVIKKFSIKRATQKMSVSLSKSTIRVGDSTKINCKNAVGKVTYSSANKQIATVNSKGVVVGKKVGTTKIVIKAAGSNNYKAARKTVSIRVKKQSSSGGSNTKTTYQKIYRLYDSVRGEHFYTPSSSEVDNLKKAGWNYEGVAWNAPVKGNPVYRLYNPNAGDHHYTVSVDEKNSLVKGGWKYEGVGWYSGGKTPLYRMYNPNAIAGAHHYTKNYKECYNLLMAGWNYEGIAWYGK